MLAVSCVLNLAFVIPISHYDINYLFHREE